MGGYCKFCDRRCFVPMPESTPPEILAAYGTASIMATCPAGQRFEKEKLGFCFDDLPAFTRTNATTELTALERAQLASAVCDCAFEAFESFQEQNIGADTAYLMGVILSIPEQHLTVDWSEDRPALLDALKAKFPADSPLWNYIVTAPPKLTTPEELAGALSRLQELGLINEVV